MLEIMNNIRESWKIKQNEKQTKISDKNHAVITSLLLGEMER